MDTDADGSVHLTELEAWVTSRMKSLKLNPPTGAAGFAKEILGKADDNKDGQLNMEEVVAHKSELEHGHYGMVLHHELDDEKSKDEL
jgi:hypothetical protein